jgi:cyclic pyranopterin phosphate synthase
MVRNIRKNNDKGDKAKVLTHIDAAGNARMVDVGAKDVTQRIAVASGTVSMAPATLKLVERKAAKKGDVLAVAQLAGIMAAKRTSELIPLCHPLGLDSVQVELKPDRKLPGIRITATCKISGMTGVEMEALTAVSVAALTVYDMLKAVDRAMVISAIQVDHKSGGMSGTYERKL